METYFAPAERTDITIFRQQVEDISNSPVMPALEKNYLEKHAAVQRTAIALLKKGIPVFAAPTLHHHRDTKDKG